MKAAQKLKVSPEAASSPALRALESRRVLVVDDEKDIVQAYKDILAPENKAATIRSSRSKIQAVSDEEPSREFEVTAVSTGEAAVEAVKKALEENRPFAMGFFDVLLGDGIDGIETVKQIHRLDPEMHAVLVTAYQDRHVDAIQKLFERDFWDRWDYLNKPFSEGEILQKARNMVSLWNIRRKNEAQQQRLDELKSQMSQTEKILTVAAVARNVGHEFGNILLQIMGRADLSRKGDETEMRRALETILVATEHASRVLDRFKNLSRPSDMTHKPEKVQISAPIRETLDLMDHEFKRRNVKIVVDISRDLPPITGSHTGLVQVFMNLVINALHAMEDNGLIEFHAALQNKAIEIKVRDAGPGIPQENLDKVFDAFFTTKGAKGTGLGLCICKEVIEINHRGKISVSNHPQGGAEFRILIPLDGEGEDL